MAILKKTPVDNKMIQCQFVKSLPAAMVHATVFAVVMLFLTGQAHAVRIKDIADIKGVRQNQLVGYGLVVGLNGTGDDDDLAYMIQSLAAMLEKFGVTVKAEDIETENVAAVMVTAEMPPFARVGSRIDVLVSSIGDAENLQGDILFRKAELMPIGDRPRGVQRGKALFGLVDEIGEARNVQKGVLLPGKTRLRQILGRSRGAHRDVPLRIQPVERREYLLLEAPGEGPGLDQGAQLSLGVRLCRRHGLRRWISLLCR